MIKLSPHIHFDSQIPGVASADVWRTVAQHLPDTIIAVDRDGIIQWINRTLPEFRRQEVIGRHCASFVSEETAARSLHVLDDVFRGEVADWYETQTLDGRWWLNRAIPVRDASGEVVTALFIASEITDRKRAEQALAEQESLFRCMVDTAPSVTFVYDHELDRVTYVNARVFELLGYTAEEIFAMGADFKRITIVAEEMPSISTHVCSLPALADGEVREITYRMRRRDGEIRWVTTRTGVVERTPEGAVRKTICETIDITEQKCIAQAFDEQRQLLQRIVRTSPAITYVWDVALDRAVYVNGQTVGMLGSEATEFLIPGHELRASRCHPDDHEIVFDAIERVCRAADHETIECEYRMRHSDGSWRWVLNRCSVLSRGADGAAELLIGVVFDKTDRHNAEQALRASEASLKSVMKHAPDLIARMDACGRITYSNRNGDDPTVCRLTETNAFAWTIPEDASILRDVLNAVFVEGKTMHTRLRVARPDGVERTYDCNFGPIIVNDVVESAIVVSRDVTDDLHAAELLRQRELQLAQATRLSTSVGMLATISHEVNQPLHAIANFSSAARRLLAAEHGANAAQVRTWLAKINEQADRAADIIRTLRQLVRNVEPKREPHDLHMLLRDCLRLCETEARKARICFVTFDADAAQVCLVDRLQIEQVLINLLRNSLEAMAEGDSTDRCVRAAITAKGAEATISIQDRGSGLPPGDAERIFEPFFSTKAGGLGLGLAICRNIVESHGGRIWATPNVGPGCTVYVTLPLVRSESS